MFLCIKKNDIFFLRIFANLGLKGVGGVLLLVRSWIYCWILCEIHSYLGTLVWLQMPSRTHTSLISDINAPFLVPLSASTPPCVCVCATLIARIHFAPIVGASLQTPRACAHCARIFECVGQDSNSLWAVYGNKTLLLLRQDHKHVVSRFMGEDTFHGET